MVVKDGVLDFDRVDLWIPHLKEALSSVATDPILAAIRDADPELVEDAQDRLFALAGRDAVIDATLAWLRSSTIAGYHGTRLTDEEVVSVRQSGLLPLNGHSRRTRLERALSFHPNWRGASARLTEVLEAHGPGNRAGHREGQAHLTLSRAGLINGFNHYLTYGSEFDKHAATALLGDEGLSLLSKDGRRRILRFAVPGQSALAAAHAHFDVDELRRRGDVPNIANDFLRVWSYRVAHPEFDPATLKVDRGMVFRSPVPAEWLADIETLAD